MAATYAKAIDNDSAGSYGSPNLNPLTFNSIKARPISTYVTASSPASFTSFRSDKVSDISAVPEGRWIMWWAAGS